MENLVLNSEFWKGRRVLVTGHTGFKGAWLCLWLHQLGARVSGLSIDMVSEPNLWSLIELDEVSHHIGDVRDIARVQQVLNEEKPEVVFHLAAQSLVRRSYREPIETFSTNVMGVVALLSAIAKSDSVKAAVIVTSDKCYENKEQSKGYVESDPMGGHDPYSASKGCAELVTASMRNSFFSPNAEGGHLCQIASARAGNVIGGGDWSEDRLIPDIVRGCLGESGQVVIRSPNSQRPWQHVLEPLRGYLMLAERLANGETGFDEGWNLGPDEGQERPVIDVANAIVGALGKGRINVQEDRANLHEAKLLQLISTKARGLGWAPAMGFDQTMEMTAKWYAEWAAGGDSRQLCIEQIEQYTQIYGGNS